jgi:hypothetical protein
VGSRGVVGGDTGEFRADGIVVGGGDGRRRQCDKATRTLSCARSDGGWQRCWCGGRRQRSRGRGLAGVGVGAGAVVRDD